MHIKHKYLIAALMLLASMGLSAASFTRSGNFVTVEVAHPGPNDPHWVRLQVVGKKIIRVEATREKTFPEKESLIIVKQQAPNFKYSVTEDSRDVKINTSAVVAKVDKQTGLVRFYDENGRQILAEDTGANNSSPIRCLSERLAWTAISPTRRSTDGRGCCASPTTRARHYMDWDSTGQ